MSSVNDGIVREYLEGLGFLVVQPRKYIPAGRLRIPEEEMDLLAFHPGVREATPAAGMLWTGRDLRRAARVLVSVRGWHTDRFGPSLLAGSPEVLRFVAPDVVARAEQILGGAVARVLCVPALPVSADLEAQALATLCSRGVSGVLPFRTILVELAGMVDVHRNYDRSDLLQTLRILKAHGMLHDGQLPLFSRRRTRRKASSPAPRGSDG